MPSVALIIVVGRRSSDSIYIYSSLHTHTHTQNYVCGSSIYGRSIYNMHANITTYNHISEGLIFILSP